MSVKHYTIGSFGFWTSYLVHMRPYLFFISGIAGLAGMSLISNFDVISIKVILTFIGLFFSYGFGQALTDCYQVDTDSISAPYRPLSRGILDPEVVKIVSVIGLGAITCVLIYYNPWNLLLGLLGIIGLWGYSYAKKEYWFAGPPLNAIIVSLLVLMGHLAVSGSSILSVTNAQVLLLAGLTFFSYLNFVLIGYLKDITADRKTGYKTFPVIFGWNRSVLLGDLNFILCTVIYANLISYSWLSIMVGIIAFCIGLSGQLYAHFTKLKTEKNSTYPIISTVRSFILWHLGVVLNFSPDLVLFAVLFYLLFEVVIYFRPMNIQI